MNTFVSLIAGVLGGLLATACWRSSYNIYRAHPLPDGEALQTLAEYRHNLRERRRGDLRLYSGYTIAALTLSTVSFFYGAAYDKAEAIETTYAFIMLAVLTLAMAIFYQFKPVEVNHPTTIIT